MTFLNLSGYQFTPLTNLDALRKRLQVLCQQHDLKGTILLSDEGVNINLSGLKQAVNQFQTTLLTHSFIPIVKFKVTSSARATFKRLKVKIKKEIITLRHPKADVTAVRADHLSPQQLKTWLDEEKTFLLLDTRNDYEVEFGTFAKAKHLGIKHFTDFKQAASNLDQQTPVVMFCTGGIRCEKAALFLKENGHNEVYQLEGGILNYFAEVGSAHYSGTCYVFDERVALDTNLNETHAQQCRQCQGPIFTPATVCQRGCSSS